MNHLTRKGDRTKILKGYPKTFFMLCIRNSSWPLRPTINFRDRDSLQDLPLVRYLFNPCKCTITTSQRLQRASMPMGTCIPVIRVQANPPLDLPQNFELLGGYLLDWVEFAVLMSSP